jgi:hypothetical protein
VRRNNVKDEDAASFGLPALKKAFDTIHA